MNYRWYDKSVAEVLRVLQTDPETGLSRKEAVARLREDGKNVISPVIRAPIRSYLFQVLSDLTGVLLLCAALLSFLFRQDAAAVAILLLLVANYTVTVLSYIHAQKGLEELARRSLPTAKVIRGGKLRVISQEQVVQGDIVLLSSGDIVPCDARLLESEQLRVMESNLFEVEEISKKDAAYLRPGIPPAGSAPNMLYCSTVVVSGRAKAVAVETGPDAVICRMKKNRPVAACHRLDVIKDLKRISRVLGILLLLPLPVFALFEMQNGVALIDLLLGALSVAVAAMPELYAAFAYVTVRNGMFSALKKDKKRKGAFIKNPLALPKLAGIDCLLLPMDALCCEGASRLVELFDGDQIVDLATKEPDESALRVLRYGLISTGLYGTERLALKHQQSDNLYTVQQEAILEAGERYEIYSKKLEEDYPLYDHLDRGEKGSLFETALVHYKGQDVVVLRGDPERVLARCTEYYKEGKILPMDEGIRGELLALAGRFSRNNRQPVAVATKNYRYNTLMRVGEAQTDLIFEGFLAIEKPFLPDAAKEVIRMRNAGIRVLLYCGEEGAENRHLARALGVATKDSQVIRHSDLAEMSEEIYKINLKNYTLFEGFDSVALGYTVSALKEDYGYRVGVFGKDLSAVSMMYRADASFSSEDGRQLIGEGGLEEEQVTAPVWAKTGSDTEKVGCQALSYLSDVIVPPVAENGEGGINGVASALRAARGVYRNIGALLFYLTFTSALRITALFFSAGNVFYLTPVQNLVLGLVFDLLAVFAIAGHGWGDRYGRNFCGEKLLGRVKRLLPAFAVGALLSAGTVLLSNVLEEQGVLLKDSRSAFVMTAFLLLQGALLALLLEQGTGRGRRAEPSFFLYLGAVVLFLGGAFFLPPLSALLGLSFMGLWGLLLAVLPALAFLLVSIPFLIVIQKKKK
jgi:Ca2+-transporting ATPase